MRRRFESVLIAGFIAGVVAACTGPTMDAMSGAMMDAGQMLADAGTAMMEDSGAGSMAMDAGRVLRDAGGSMQDAGRSLHDDAGQTLRDAGRAMMDAGRSVKDAATQDGAAQAQSCGEWCSAEGATRMITADQDTTRWARGIMQSAAWSLDDSVSSSPSYYLFQAEVLDGPFVMRSSSFENNGQGHGLYVVTGGTCGGQTVTGLISNTPPANWITPDNDPYMILGTETLCAYWLQTAPMGNPAPTPPRVHTWGYRPYE